jgi:hypothetical protein
MVVEGKATIIPAALMNITAMRAAVRELWVGKRTQ